MTALELVTLLLQLVMPLALIGRVAFSRHRHRPPRALDVALAGSYLAAIWIAGLWLALPRGLVGAYAVLLVVAALVGSRRGESAARPRSSGRGRAGFWARAAVASGFAASAVFALAGRRPFESTPMDVAFPLRGGTYLVASGGSNILVNPHLKTHSAERFPGYTGQSYAVDLVGVGRWGSRASRLSPEGPEGFAIFADVVHAPCAGRVVRARDSQPDRLRPGVAPELLEGNHVILACGEIWVVLAHLKQGSVRVEEGDHVEPGDPLGLVGNSGRSDEPHLHIHAQAPGTSEAALSGAPIPITFGGRHLVRNDRICTRTDDSP